MDKSKEKVDIPKKNTEWITSIAKTQLGAVEEAQKIIEDVLRRGIAAADIEYREELCYHIEGLMDYYAPNILRSFRHLFSVLFHAENPKMYPVVVDHMNYLLAVLGQAKKYLKLRIEGAEPDITSPVETHIGYLWKNTDLLAYKLYEEDTEIIQLSLSRTKDVEKMIFMDKAHWFSFKTNRIHYTCKIRPIGAARYIKNDNTEFDVLQLKRLFVYPGKINSRARWETKEKRKATLNDMTTLLEKAETNYTKVVGELKESLRNPLFEQNPAILIKLHKAFINGDHLVLEDEQGGFLTVADTSEDSVPTSELLRLILPAQLVDCALLVEVNDATQANLFSVKPLSIITSNRIIRLLY